MARSSYIYVVEEHWDDGNRSIAAAFTVKHELVAWLKRATGEYRVTRVGDGIFSSVQTAVLSIKELLA